MYDTKNRIKHNVASIHDTGYVRTWKIIVIGDSNVGKTQIINTYREKKLELDDVKATVNAQYDETIIETLGDSFKLCIWDTAGQERYRSLIKTYFRSAKGVLLVYDITNKSSFKHCKEWLSILRSSVHDENIVVILVGNKIDLDIGSDIKTATRDYKGAKTKSSRMVLTSDALSFAQTNGLFYLETSAITGININQIFEMIISELLHLDKLDKSIPKKMPNGYKLCNIDEDCISKHDLVKEIPKFVIEDEKKKKKKKLKDTNEVVINNETIDIGGNNNSTDTFYSSDYCSSDSDDMNQGDFDTKTKLKSGIIVLEPSITDPKASQHSAHMTTKGLFGENTENAEYSCEC